MSLFKTITLHCPSCTAAMEFKVVHSVNADRRPDLRAAIIDGSFQNSTCPKCSTEFRLDPEMTYLDVGRLQWIAVFPLSRLPQWKELEAQTRDTFAKAYGAKASAAAKQIGAGLKPRLTFGWGALREKLIAAEYGLDDVVLELVKSALMRGLEDSPLEPGTELRLIAVEEGDLIMGWMRSATDEPEEFLQAPRSLYDEIVADPAAWQPLRETLDDGPFVDINKLLVVTA